MGNKKSKEAEPEASKDDKKDDVSPENVDSAADKGKFDGFLDGKRPDGKSRRCTDCLCLLMVVSDNYLKKEENICFYFFVFINIYMILVSMAQIYNLFHCMAINQMFQIACWVFITILGIRALNNGEPQKLIGGLDYKGRICGYSGAVANKYMWNIVAWDGAGTCLNKCPTRSTWNTVGWFDKNDIDQLVCKSPYNTTEWWSEYPFFLILNKQCMFEFSSTDYLGFCVLDDMTVFADIFNQYFALDDG